MDIHFVFSAIKLYGTSPFSQNWLQVPIYPLLGVQKQLLGSHLDHYYHIFSIFCFHATLMGIDIMTVKVVECT